MARRSVSSARRVRSDRRRRGGCVWHVGFMARYVAMSSPTAVYSRVVRSSLVVMDVVWFCTARVYIARYYISL